MESIFDDLNKDVVDGMNGKVQSIPIGLSKLGRYANIRKKILTLIFSTTGAGKSALIDTIILNACDSHMKTPTKLKPDFQLFSMERNKKMRIAKWISYLIFKNEGEIIELPRIMGWWEDAKLSKAEHSLFLSQKQYIDQI